MREKNTIQIKNYQCMIKKKLAASIMVGSQFSIYYLSLVLFVLKDSSASSIF